MKKRLFQIDVGYRKPWTIILIMTLFLFSCKKGEEETQGSLGPALVSVSLQSVRFSDIRERIISGKTSFTDQPFTNAGQNGPVQWQGSPVVQRKEIPLGKGMTLVAELTAQREMVNKQSGNVNKILEAPGDKVTTPISTGTRYKLVVFDANGNYKTFRDYTYGSEANAAPLMLDGGSSYTFVAYSVNSTSELPNLFYENNGPATLANARMLAGTGGELMYFKKQMPVFGDGTNYLGITLAHQFCQITTIINTANLSGSGDKRINAVTGYFKPNATQATLNLNDGNISVSGADQNVNLTFSGLGTTLATSLPVSVNAATTTGSLVFTSMNIGGVLNNNPPAVNGLIFTRGIKYNLTLNVTETTVITPGITVGPVEWAPGNLYFDNTDPDNPYKFRDDITRYEFDSYWATDFWRWMAINPGEAKWNVGDPCKLVLPKGTWRMPTAKTLTGVNGYWALVSGDVKSLEGATVSTAVKDYTELTANGKKIRFNHYYYPVSNGTMVANYWTADHAPFENIPGVDENGAPPVMYFNVGGAAGGATSVRTFPRDAAEMKLIRCVRDTPK